MGDIGNVIAIDMDSITLILGVHDLKYQSLSYRI